MMNSALESQKPATAAKAAYSSFLRVSQESMMNPALLLETFPLRMFQFGNAYWEIGRADAAISDFQKWQNRATALRFLT